MKVNKIVVVGGGSAGWMTAATLITAFPNKDIHVIESKDVPILGVGESTIGGIRNWTRFIGLSEVNFFPATDASLKLSIKFTDFYRKNGGSFHYPFGMPLADQNQNPFFYWHLKKYLYPETPVEDFVRCLFPSASLFENNKFSLNSEDEFDNFNVDNDVAYHFDATKFANWLREEVCIPKGVNHVIDTVSKVNTNSMGVESLETSSGELITADLFIDCTGFKSLLLAQALQEPFRSMSDMLPNNKAWATRIQYEDKEKELEGFTNCTAIGNGWCWNIPLWSRLGAGYVYSDKYVTSEEALEEFKQYLMSEKMVVPRTREQVDSLNYKSIDMRVGIHERTFVKNVVAIGLSAGFIEPLESNGLFSVHEFLFKLVDILQRGHISQFDRDMYNISVRTLFDNFSRFVALHYALSHRDDTEYWKDIKNKSFTGWDGDPYTPYLGKADAFSNMIWRYMDEWGHPYGNQGITYIATGMNVFMINASRFMNLSYRTNKDLVEDVNAACAVWDQRKIKWKKAANVAPTLKTFLEENFYGKS